jgi:hypothetical protein
MGMLLFCLILPGTDKIRFGAVLEEFEVRDALESVFYKESDATMV